MGKFQPYPTYVEPGNRYRSQTDWISIVGSPYIGPLGLIGTLMAGIYFRRLDPFLRMLVVAFGVIGLYGLLSGFGTNLGLAY